jgi:hypothetical protein
MARNSGSGEMIAYSSKLDGRQRRRRLGKATIPLQKAAALV